MGARVSTSFPPTLLEKACFCPENKDPYPSDCQPLPLPQPRPPLPLLHCGLLLSLNTPTLFQQQAFALVLTPAWEMPLPAPTQALGFRTNVTSLRRPSLIPPCALGTHI